MVIGHLKNTVGEPKIYDGQPNKTGGNTYKTTGSLLNKVGDSLRVPEQSSDDTFGIFDQPKPMQNMGNTPSARPASPPEGTAGTAAKPPSGTGAPNAPPASPDPVPELPPAASPTPWNPERSRSWQGMRRIRRQSAIPGHHGCLTERTPAPLHLIYTRVRAKNLDFPTIPPSLSGKHTRVITHASVNEYLCSARNIYAPHF